MIADCGSGPTRGAFAQILGLDNRAVVRQTMGTLSGVCAPRTVRGARRRRLLQDVGQVTSAAIEKAEPGHPCTAVPSL